MKETVISNLLSTNTKAGRNLSPDKSVNGKGIKNDIAL